MDPWNEWTETCLMNVSQLKWTCKQGMTDAGSSIGVSFSYIAN